MKILTKAGNIFDHINNGFAVFAIILLVFVMLTISYDVATRRAFGSVQWVMEISEFALLYIVFLAAAWLLRKDGHVKMDLLLIRSKPRTQAIINTITSIASALTCLVIAWYSTEVTIHYIIAKTVVAPSVIEPLKWPTFIIIPIGTFMLFIQFVRRTYGFIRVARAP